MVASDISGSSNTRFACSQYIYLYELPSVHITTLRTSFILNSLPIHDQHSQNQFFATSLFNQHFISISTMASSSRSTATSATNGASLTLALRGKAYEYTQATHDEFLIWWQCTEWALGLSAGTNAKYRLPCWDSKARKAELWKDFTQAALISDGTPLIVCNDCGTKLAHPSATNIGTSHMRNHRATKTCRDSSSTPQTAIDEMFRVSIAISIF